VLQNNATVILDQPKHTAFVLQRNTACEAVIRAGQLNIQAARRLREVLLQAAVVAAVDPNASMELAVLQNGIAYGDLEVNEPVPIQLTDSEKTQDNNTWRTYRERNASLAKHRGQTYSLILGQCSQLLKDKMKQDIQWGMVSVSYDHCSGRSVPVCYCLRTRTVFLFISPREYEQSSVVRAFQHES
jgi:hypothetical protein